VWPSGSEAEGRRFVRRFSFFEEPVVLEQLERYAMEAGRSTASEIRAALRWWIQGHEDDDD
jgi:hypothetical protein